MPNWIANQTKTKLVNLFMNDSKARAEKIGDWFWVSGSGAKGRKEELKRMGFKYSGKKKAWYKMPKRHGAASGFAGKPLATLRRKFKPTERLNYAGKQQSRKFQEL